MKKIVIIGGVAGGASTAARARRLDEGAEIILLERGNHVSFANCGLPYHIGGIIAERAKLMVQTPATLKASLNIDVRCGHEARKIDRTAHTVRIRELLNGREYTERYDKLVLCPGAAPILPPLPGIDNPRILTLRNIDDMDRIMTAVTGGLRRVAIVGAGYIGIEMAENFRTRGIPVDLVEMLDQILPPFDRDMAQYLQQQLTAHGVTLHLGTAAVSFRDVDGGVNVELKNGASLSVDLVIMAIGVRPETTLAREAGLELGPRHGIKVDGHMRTSDPDIYAAGDAVEVTDTITGEPALIPLAGPANRQGRIVADTIMGYKSRYTTTQGTAILKVFDLIGACTGASEKTLVRTGRIYRKVYLHPTGHAGYYPGTAIMHLKLMFAPGDGRILGAQIVGNDGVDKRIDVLATAIRGGMTVHDLTQLELAYAPPFGAAKDPVNMAGFVAENMLNGLVEFWYAEQFPAVTAGGTILDVRSPPEFNEWHIPGAINIPLGELRAQADTLPATTPLFVYCKVGLRSYLAYRLLKHRGFRVATLAGGALTFAACKGNQPS